MYKLLYLRGDCYDIPLSASWPKGKQIFQEIVSTMTYLEQAT